MNTRAAAWDTGGHRGPTDAVTSTVAAAGERGRQGTTRGVIYQPGSTLTKFGTFPENRTTSVSRSLTGSRGPVSSEVDGVSSGCRCRASRDGPSTASSIVMAEPQRK